MDFLSEIIALKKPRLQDLKEKAPVTALRERAYKIREHSTPHSFSEALICDGINVIAEVKRASPSLGTIRDDAEPALFARLYEQGGAAAVSVLTEEERFKGSLDDLRSVRSAVQIPVLRKDFIFDDYQVYETAEAGADALLLIVAALDQSELTRLRSITENELHLDALVEVHTRDEVSRAVDAGATMIGVNNRDLRTFRVTLETSIELIRSIPNGLTAVSESGLRTGNDLRLLRSQGYKGFLIGEALMRAQHPELALRTLLDASAKSS